MPSFCGSIGAIGFQTFRHKVRMHSVRSVQNFALKKQWHISIHHDAEYSDHDEVRRIVDIK